MQTVHDFLKKAGTYYLATIDGDQPRLRPFGTILLFEDKLYILTSRSKDVAKQLTINPKAEFSAMVDNTWIRISTTLTEDNRTEIQESMLEAYPQLKGMYVVGDGNTLVYCLTNATAVFYTFGSEPREVHF